MTTNAGYTKRDFVEFINRKIYVVMTRIRNLVSRTYESVNQQAVLATLADPALETILASIRDLVGERTAQSLRVRLEEFGSKAISPNYRYARFDDLDGQLLALLQSHGWVPIPAEPALDDNTMTYLTGAFAFSKAKYWDALFPPTKTFLERLDDPDLTIDGLRDAIRRYAAEIS